MGIVKGQRAPPLASLIEIMQQNHHTDHINNLSRPYKKQDELHGKTEGKGPWLLHI
jgi:hypothetical protein